MFEPMETTNDAVIKVIGRWRQRQAPLSMVRERIEGVEFFAVNTDAQALRETAVGQTIPDPVAVLQGLGAGANPEVGRNAADEETSRSAARSLDNEHGVHRGRHGRRYRYRRGAVVAEVAKDLGDPHRCGGH